MTVTSNDAGSNDDGPLSRAVLGFEATLKRLVKAAREPGFTPAGWAPLAEFVATGDFERVGTWMEVMNWQQYTEFLTQWAAASLGFDTTVRRPPNCPAWSTSRSRSAIPAPAALPRSTRCRSTSSTKSARSATSTSTCDSRADRDRGQHRGTAERNVVAGASEGVGVCLADQVAAPGLDLVLIAPSEPLLNDVAAGIRERHGVEVR